MPNNGAVKWFKEKAARKATRKLASEKHELSVLKAKYRPRPIPIQNKVSDVPGELPYMSLGQMLRYQTLLLDYKYYPLRDQGLTHDEAEEKVFPEAFAYRKKQEREQEAFANQQELNNIQVDGLEVEVA